MNVFSLFSFVSALTWGFYQLHDEDDVDHHTIHIHRLDSLIHVRIVDYSGLLVKPYRDWGVEKALRFSLHINCKTSINQHACRVEKTTKTSCSSSWVRRKREWWRECAGVDENYVTPQHENTAHTTTQRTKQPLETRGRNELFIDFSPA